jgi:predicted ATPase
MGKTRLLTEFCRRVAGNQVTVYEGSCLSYGQATPYLPVRDLVRQLCGLVEGDEPAGHTAAVQQRLHASGMTADDDVALLEQLLDLPVAPERPVQRSPEARQARTFALLRQLVLDAAQQQPLVLMVENLHWIDPTSLELLDLIVDAVPTLPVLLIITFRPEFVPPWIGRPQVTFLTLNRLSPAQRAEMIAGMTGGRAFLYDPDGRHLAALDTRSGNAVPAIQRPDRVREILRQVRDRHRWPPVIRGSQDAH